MKRAPVPAAIHEAELRAAQSSRNVGDGLRRVRLAVSTTLARPSMLVMVAGATGLFCFWLARRTRARSVSPAKGLWDTIATSVLGLVMAFVLRYGRRRLETVFR